MSTRRYPPILPATQRTRMAIELVMEVVHQPTWAHVLQVLHDADARALAHALPQPGYSRLLARRITRCPVRTIERSVRACRLTDPSRCRRDRDI